MVGRKDLVLSCDQRIYGWNFIDSYANDLKARRWKKVAFGRCDDYAKEGDRGGKIQNHLPCQLPNPGSFIPWLLALVSACLWCVGCSR